jgi:tRNA pseudouridine32 synthase/23S rRNA pseudouridine746 synthase
MNAELIPVREGVSPSCVALPSGPWGLALDFLAQRLPVLSREQWQLRMAQGKVLDAQGQVVPSDAPYRAQTKLYYWRHVPDEQPIPQREAVLFQDELLLVADKPPFLPVIPSGRYVQETLLVRLRRQTGIDTLTPVHRIDMDTTGLVLFCIQPRWRDAYQALFRTRQVGKVYEAMAPWHEGLALPMVRRSRLQESAHFMVMEEVAGEPNAETAIELIEAQGGVGHYRLKPVTGQKHQLRAHMNALGTPIVNDRIYPHLVPELAPHVPRDFSAPLKLLAQSLAFTDPVSGQAREFASAQHLNW